MLHSFSFSVYSLFWLQPLLIFHNRSRRGGVQLNSPPSLHLNSTSWSFVVEHQRTAILRKIFRQNIKVDNCHKEIASSGSETILMKFISTTDEYFGNSWHHSSYYFDHRNYHFIRNMRIFEYFQVLHYFIHHFEEIIHLWAYFLYENRHYQLSSIRQKWKGTEIVAGISL